MFSPQTQEPLETSNQNKYKDLHMRNTAVRVLTREELRGGETREELRGGERENTVGPATKEDMDGILKC